MIRIPSPAMALNSADVPGAGYRMYNTWNVPETTTPEHLLDWTATVAMGAPGGRLRGLVINCHGFYGTGSSGSSVGGFGLKMGTGLYAEHAPLFGALAGKVDKIWITACGTARISGNARGDGHAFCAAIARAARSYVVAATTHQVGDLWLPAGYIDDFEGLVVRYNPQGAIDWQRDYGRSIIDGLVNGYN